MASLCLLRRLRAACGPTEAGAVDVWPTLRRLGAPSLVASRGASRGRRGKSTSTPSRAPDEVEGPEDDGTGGGAGELVQSGGRVYRRSRAEHQRIFRWGIGNSFRMQSENRFRPVHKPHPQETMVRDDYYKSDNPNISWEELNETWEVYWYEHNKLNARPFPVKKFGIERAKRAAQDFYEQLREAGRLHSKPGFASPQPGVFYDNRMQDWICFFWRGGRPVARGFSAAKYGYDGARTLAVAKQRDPVNGVLHFKPKKGETPSQLTGRSA